MKPPPRTATAEQDRQVLLHALDALLIAMVRAATDTAPPSKAVLAAMLAQHQAMRHQRNILLAPCWAPLGRVLRQALLDAQVATAHALGSGGRTGAARDTAQAHHASIARYRVLLAHWPLVVNHPPTSQQRRFRMGTFTRAVQQGRSCGPH